MKIAVFGLGYVGFTAACCLADQGHAVVGVDVNEEKVDEVNAGAVLFAEPELDLIASEQVRSGRLSATKSTTRALEGADLAFVCVGTPSSPDGAHDMRYIVGVSRQIAVSVSRVVSDRPLTVAYRSTIRPGSLRKLVAPIFRTVLGSNWRNYVELVYNPEFLREAQAVHDFRNPPKIVIGTWDGLPNALMTSLNRGIDAPTFITKFEEAELTKFVDNAWHATKVAFANEIGRICQTFGLSAEQVHQIFVADTKLNISPYYTRPGGAFGGSCLPKDVRALQNLASGIGANAYLLESLLRSNEAHKHYQFRQIVADLPSDARVLVVGLAFKAGTDDLRESPNVDLVCKLIEAGVQVSVFDPGLDPAKLRGQNLGYAYNHLPTIDTLLIDRLVAETGPWDRVIATNATAGQLDLSGFSVVETHTIR